MKLNYAYELEVCTFKTLHNVKFADTLSNVHFTSKQMEKEKFGNLFMETIILKSIISAISKEYIIL